MKTLNNVLYFHAQPSLNADHFLWKKRYQKVENRAIHADAALNLIVLQKPLNSYILSWWQNSLASSITNLSMPFLLTMQLHNGFPALENKDIMA